MEEKETQSNQEVLNEVMKENPFKDFGEQIEDDSLELPF